MSDLRMELIQGQLRDIEENVRSIKATWGNTIMTLDNIKSSLKADRQKAIEEAYLQGKHDAEQDLARAAYEEAYQNGYEVGQHEATTLEYQQGLNDAWEMAKRIALVKTDEDCPYFSVAELEKIFGCSTYQSVFDTYSAPEAIEKFQAYEQQKADEIKVGDEVRNTLGLMDNAVGYFFGDSSDGCYKVLRYVDGKFKTGIWNKENCERTGKHSYAVERMVAVMKEGAECTD